VLKVLIAATFDALYVARFVDLSSDKDLLTAPPYGDTGN